MSGYTLRANRADATGKRGMKRRNKTTRTIHVNKVIFALFGLVVSVQVLADWKVTERIDAMTDKLKKTAQVTNDQGQSFSVYRADDGSVWCNFALSDKNFEQIDSEHRPAYRIDKNDLVDLNEGATMSERLGIHNYEWKPKWVNFLIWHGIENEGLSLRLKGMMSGKQLLIRYYVVGGGYKDTSFDLVGAGKAITTALGIKYKPSKEDNAKTAIDAKLLSYHLKCRDGSPRDSDEEQRCVDRATSCRDKAMKALDVAVFNQCMN